jgi:hypothetical protein
MRGIINDPHEITNIFNEYFTVIGSSELDRPTTTASNNILFIGIISITTWDRTKLVSLNITSKTDWTKVIK